MKRYIHKNYQEYATAQLQKYYKKQRVIFAADEELIKIAEVVRRLVPQPRFGICHGVRTGYEVWRLRNLLGIEVIGTDIAPVEQAFGGVTVVRWDFHDRNPEWIGQADIVYSNSWDHSYDPEQMIKTWIEQLSPQGILVLSWTPHHAEEVDAGDCFSCNLDEFLRFLLKHIRIVEIHTVQQWRHPARSAVFNIARRILKRRPIKEITVIVCRPNLRVPGNETSLV
jgi:hypothetical protein